MYSWLYFSKVNRLGNSKSISQFQLTSYEIDSVSILCGGYGLIYGRNCEFKQTPFVCV